MFRFHLAGRDSFQFFFRFLSFRTGGVEDAHLTLAAIPFQVGVNNALIFLPLQRNEKKSVEFPFL